jgi:peptidoglycan/xylan/chitin deacetylase (PgdA/CDA1 family)
MRAGVEAWSSSVPPFARQKCRCGWPPTLFDSPTPARSYARDGCWFEGCKNLLVLLYHRVSALEYDPYRLAVRPDHFVQHVEHLQALNNVEPLLEWASPSLTPRIAVTFDDGYADNAALAAPLLEEAELPTTWFITSDLVGGGRFWWDTLADAFLQTTTPSLEAQLGGEDIWLDMSTARARHQALIFVHRRIKPLPPDEICSELENLLNACGTSAPDLEARAMTVDDLRALAARSGAEIGGHTRTHVQLGGQAEKLQRDQVLGCVTALESMIGRTVRTFAYPFGDPTSIGDLAPRLVAQSGCHLACSTVQGSAGKNSSPYMLPRLTVHDWDGAEFANRIAAALRTDR